MRFVHVAQGISRGSPGRSPAINLEVKVLLVFPQRHRARRDATCCLIAAVLVLVSPTAATTQEVATPTVTGPVPSQRKPDDSARSYIFYSTPMNLIKVGYVEQEYFISGSATRYSFPTTPGDATVIGTMPYRTRIVVRRPASPNKFKGVVVVDWQNVTAGHDIDTEWALASEFFIRSGWAWVGASVQRIGVHGFEVPNPSAGRGLRQWSPTRYESLDVTNGGTVTDDSQSYDIYSQIAHMLKHPRGVNPFDGMKVERVYAGGVSQSANFLIRYYNSVQPTSKAYDGFVIGTGGARPRLDLPTKLFKVNTETDVWRGQAAVRVPDTNATHTWELAGASHVGAAMMSPDTNNFRAILGGILARDIRPQALPSQCVRPYASDVETWAVYSAAYAALDRWVTKGVKPPTAVPIQVSAAPASPELATIVRDNNGIAVGGIRLPRVVLPTALNTGENLPANTTDPASRFCVLFGTHIPFDAAKVKALYPSRAAYLREVKRVVDQLVRGGFILKADAPTLLRNAANAGLGT